MIRSRTGTRFALCVALASLAACSSSSSAPAPGGTPTLAPTGTAPDGNGPDAGMVRAPLGDGETPGASNGAGEGDAFGASPTVSDGVASSSGAAGSAPPGAGSPAGGAVTTPIDSPIVGDGGPNVQVPAGVLTAGAWDDNRNYDRFLSFQNELTTAQTHGLLPLTRVELDAAHTLAQAGPGPHQTLDVALMIDTTGSMGDELAYLQSEFVSLAGTIAQRYPNAAQRWSLVAYKDRQDPYIVRWFDFRTDIQDFQTNLAALTVGGGGDFPESPERALAQANQLTWRSDPGTAKLLFWVADAPHHDEDAAAMADAVRGARNAGVHVYPVASSGIDDMTELTMREAAQLTGGRYQFLTDDSGIGNAHKAPRIPCYFVTKLSDGILRMVNIELSGTYREPATSEIVRSSGAPAGGCCTIEGDVTNVY